MPLALLIATASAATPDATTVSEPPAPVRGAPLDTLRGTATTGGSDAVDDREAAPSDDPPAIRIVPRGEVAATPDGSAPEADAPEAGSVPDRGTAHGDAGPETSATLTPRTDLDALPDPVRRMRRLLLDAAVRGDLNAVARLAGVGETMTQLSLAPEGEDATTLLRQQSGDDEGYEVLAILAEILEAPYVVIDEGTPDALYLWPWFAGASLDALTPAEQVAIFRLMTAGDFQQSLEFGTYVFFRTGIGADGTWAFFLAGD